jgi:hypothetical protein
MENATQENLSTTSDNGSNLIPQVFRLRSNKRWSKTEFPSTEGLMSIGSNSIESEVLIKDMSVAETQLVGRFLGNDWHLIERGSDSLTKFNGIKKRQDIIKAGSAAVVKIKDHTFVFKSKKPGNDKMELGLPNAYHIKTPSGVYAFPNDRPVLLGANEACDIQIPGDEEFAAAINCHNNNYYYVYPVIAGENDPESYPLTGKTRLKVNNDFVIVQLPEELPPAPPKDAAADISKGNLALLEIDGPERTVCGKLHLPDKGETIYIGRDKNNYFAIDSLKLSRKHCQITIYRNSILLVDAQSKNGTSVNGEKINKKVAHPGDTIRFGNKKYVLAYFE